MRILIISTFFPPLNSIASLRPHSWAKEWSQQGHEVTVLTTKKNQEPSLELKFSNTSFQVIEVETKSKLNTLKNKTKSTQKPSILRKLFEWTRNRYGIYNSCRMPDLTDKWIKPAIAATNKYDDWDIVISTAGPYTVHFVAHALKKNGKAKFWIADYRDPWSDSFVYPGVFPLNILEKMIERYLMKSADMITTVSDPLKEAYQKKYGQKKAHTITNGFDPSDLNVIDKNPAFEDDTKYRIVHTGSIYAGKRDPSPLFQSIAELASDITYKELLNNLEVLFVGSNQANLQKLIKQYRVENWVKEVGFKSRDKSLAMQRDAHALLFLPWNDKNVDGVLTGKLFEYLYSKTPIIAVGCQHIEASQRIILESNAGYAFTSTSQIKYFLKEVLRHPEKKLSAVDKKTLYRYDRKTIAHNFLNLIQETRS
ncbi:MAG: glycosyltransferase family 4 protein [Chlamydiota bacterium]|nr:glycosyltransferase family 4 protein [Chlamydiota bacterium]